RRRLPRCRAPHARPRAAPPRRAALDDPPAALSASGARSPGCAGCELFRRGPRVPGSLRCDQLEQLTLAREAAVDEPAHVTVDVTKGAAQASMVGASVLRVERFGQQTPQLAQHRIA